MLEQLDKKKIEEESNKKIYKCSFWAGYTAENNVLYTEQTPLVIKFCLHK